MLMILAVIAFVWFGVHRWREDDKAFDRVADGIEQLGRKAEKWDAYQKSLKGGK